MSLCDFMGINCQAPSSMVYNVKIPIILGTNVFMREIVLIFLFSNYLEILISESEGIIRDIKTVAK